MASDLYTIIYADLDGLKEANDSYGHEGGDVLLRKLSQVFQDNTRHEDIVARVGGDEFDEAIIKHVRNVHNLIIGESTAENVKITIGNASPDKKIDKIEIKGTDAITGLPRKLEKSDRSHVVL